MELTFKNITGRLQTIFIKLREVEVPMERLIKDTDGGDKDEMQKEVWATLYGCFKLVERIMMTYSILHNAKLKGPQDDFDRKFLYEEKCRDYNIWTDAFYGSPTMPRAYILIKTADKDSLILRREHSDMFRDVSAPGKVFWCYAPTFYEPPVLDKHRLQRLSETAFQETPPSNPLR